MAMEALKSLAVAVGKVVLQQVPGQQEQGTSPEAAATNRAQLQVR